MRHLASVKVITDIKPISGADLIECAYVGGWPVVVKKDEFKVGQSIIYFEIDSVLPIKPEYEFLRKSSYKKLHDGTEGFRLKTVRLRGQISQGLILPLTFSACIGDDLTEQLGVVKYDPPLPASLSGVAIGLFPSFVRKTDEERVQNIPEVLASLDEVYITEKLDGTSFTAFVNGGNFGVCSRNLQLENTPENTLWRIANEYGLETKLKTLGRNIAVQGEVIGSGVQGNQYKLQKQDLYLFSVYDIDTQEYLGYNDLVEMSSVLGVKTVPLVYSGDFKNINCGTVEDILNYADGASMINGSPREGVVIRSLDGKTSFKAISNTWLFTNNE